MELYYFYHTNYQKIESFFTDLRVIFGTLNFIILTSKGLLDKIIAVY